MSTISTQDYVLDKARRKITTSPILTVPGMGLLEKRLLAHDWPQHAWAEPPAGSDLKPVMGDNGLPIVGHMVEMFRGGPDYLAAPVPHQGADAARSIPQSFRRSSRSGPMPRRRSTPIATRISPNKAGCRPSGRSSSAA